MWLSRIFTPDDARYEGVRPINIYLLRVFYALMVLFVATDSWSTIVTHEGAWDRFRAMAFCVWATYTSLAILGVFHPLRMLPIMLFAVGYKTLWLAIVAYPLWRAGTLWDSPEAAMTKAYIAAPFLAIVIPWGYVFRHYVMGRLPSTTAAERVPA